MADKFSGHFVVGRQGTVWQCVHEDFWSNHLFAGKKLFDFNRRSLAIFLVNEMYLEKENNQLYAFGIKKPHNIYKGPVFEHTAKGYKYWADCEELQINALINLLKDLSERHGIPLTMLRNTMEYDQNAWLNAGIISAPNANQDLYGVPLAPWVTDKMQTAGIRLH